MRTTFCIMLLLAIILQGCGRKGPLYLSPESAATPASSEPEKVESNKQP